MATLFPCFNFSQGSAAQRRAQPETGSIRELRNPAPTPAPPPPPPPAPAPAPVPTLAAPARAVPRLEKLRRAFDAPTFLEEKRIVMETIDYLNNESFAGFTRAILELESQIRKGSAELRNHRTTMLAAVEVHGPILQYCSPALRADPEVVLAALEKHPNAAPWAGEVLWFNRDFVLQAVQGHGSNLEHACEDLKADREVVLAAVQKTGYALKHASPELRDDEEVVLAALSHSAQSLQYAGDVLRADREVVKKALIKQNGELRTSNILRYASPELKQDKDIVLLAMRLAASHEVAGDGYKQAHQDLKTIPKLQFEKAMKSAIACSGEAAPVLTIRISELEDPSRDPRFVGKTVFPGSRTFLVEATMMSGTNFQIEVATRAGCCNLNDVARRLTQALPQIAEVEKPQRLTLIIMKRGEVKEEDESISEKHRQTNGTDSNSRNGKSDEDNKNDEKHENDDDDAGDDDGDDDDASDEETAYLASPWDWDRPVADFLA